METMRTIACKLMTTKPQQEHIEQTLAAFAAACNYVADYGRKTGVRHQFGLHAGCYHAIREKFSLKSNLAVRAIARVAATLRRKPQSRFSPTSADFDERIFSFDERDWSVKLTLLNSRERFYLHVGDYQKQALAGKHPTSAKLVKKKKNYFINIQIKEESPDPSPSNDFLGVDLGIKNIATTSDGTNFGGQTLNGYRLKRHKVRKSLQSNADMGKRSTRKNARRALKRLSGKESRAVKQINHTISRRIVNVAHTNGQNIVLEDLTGIRDRTNKRLRKSQRGLHNSWSFFELHSMIEYKAAMLGVVVLKMNPAYTSQTCSICGQRGKRTGERFSCSNCGELHADLNAARNIAVGGVVNLRENSPTKGRVNAYEFIRG